ncbi:methyltransferase [Bradyrhizobium canariense]|uniref:Methyltransferase n=1 Tax=Bradyrhizobium canariense TaxID=255045 RepID=A0A1X3GTH4_9BRAD|nr:methyltransferase [Bradyrhizobium canariense]OSI82338.1 methyltransferase [Bradyrhizobium canariense]OSI96631.1 methyltransferase [Bradyrhizobium canariense]OSI98356.1 methyltransferase [Bradyrhizobium canariense]OSJ15688.1 methyltransferase [Bradyrhizobium canariense]
MTNNGSSPACPIKSCTDTSWYADAHDIEYSTSDRTYSFYRCQTCDILFIVPMLWDRLGEIYPKNYYSYAPKKRGIVPHQRSLERRLLKLLASIPGDRLSVLDIGGGSGWMLDQIKSCSPRVGFTQCVDLDGAAQAHAVARGHAYHLGRIEQFDTDRRFDLVQAFDLIEHVRDPALVLRRIAGLLTDHGRVLISTPNFDALDARLFRHCSWAGYHTPRHFVMFNRQSFTALAEQSGLAVESFSYTPGATYWAASVLNAMRRLGLVEVSPQRLPYDHPLYPLLKASFAAFDFARRPFARLSKMVFTLSRRCPPA